MDEYLTVKEVASLLRIKERKVYDLVSKGELPCSKAIGKLLFPRIQISQWIAHNAQTVSIAAPMARPNLFLGSHDPLLDWAIREARCGLATLFDSSRDGLNRLANFEGIAAGTHLPNISDDGWNTDVVNAEFANAPVVLIEWAKRTRGIALGPNIKLAHNHLSALKGLKIVPRQEGAGTQIFFENKLAEAGIAPSELNFTEPARSENDLVQTVSAGSAQACFALQSIAANFKLDFVPIAQERFDVLIDRRSWFEEPVQALFAFARTPRFAAKAKELTGYDISGLGTVHFNGA